MLEPRVKGDNMLRERMYVRCPADIESATDPRVFICGQIVKIDDFKKTVTIRIHDPFNYLQFFETLPKGLIEVPISLVDHCSFFIGTEVIAKDKICKILTKQQSKDETFFYYVQVNKDKSVFRVSEKEIVASFTNGKVDPTVQLRKYEFQNPCWYLGHAVVSRSMNILENSIYGFKELAGSKIYLLPHQVNTIMRCLQEKPCRYILADEVGMGKTVEAISVLKIYLQNKANNRALIIVPDTLNAQWKSELLLKFNIPDGVGKDGNCVIVKSMSDLKESDVLKWDFVIIDEVHRYLANKYYCGLLHSISINTKNILLLSATPVQQRKEEYLDLLRLLQPQKYDTFDITKFSELIGKQGHIIQKTALILDDLGDFEEEINSATDSGEDPHNSEDCEELFEEIRDDLENICVELNDSKLSKLFEEISYDANDLGVYQIKVVISYICGNYQIESHVIRNRRKILEASDEGTRLLPIRKLNEVTYALDKDKNSYEAICYELITNWLIKGVSRAEVENYIRPALGCFFSSPWAFYAQLQKMICSGVQIESALISNAEKWVETEKHTLSLISDILNEPDKYEDECCSRLITVVNYIYEELYNQKIVLFTNYTETFDAYRSALQEVFKPEEISFFGVEMETDAIELNAYRFQNEETCHIMLCDYSGGEGRNFQCADYVIHIDLPWDANMIEQRIGRLDRLERDPARPIVTSVVVHTEDSFEAALFEFWNAGLNIFNQSLSGMEIIMKDINEQIISAVEEDFKYGLFERVPKIIELAKSMRETVRKEQNYDAAGFMFRPMYTELKRLIDYYAQNENELFSSTMTNWASLAGFRGFGNKKTGIVTYTATSFSPKSAVNSQLIPPRWNEYLSAEQNKFVNRVQDSYNQSKAIKGDERSIKGTFTRKLAIENDYLHFFAPGDEVFDCIVNNAINSCKGKSSAFATLSSFDWKGLVFVWSMAPNEAYLLDHGVSVYALGPYRNYLMSEQVTVAVSIDNPDSISAEEIEREYAKIISSGINKSAVIHLGKRSREAKYLKDIINENANISWFKQEFPEEKWSDIVDNARKSAYQRALERFKRRSNIRGARDEMERTLSARVANSEFYGISDDKIEEIKNEQEVLMEAIRHSRITLDSAAFIWMVKDTNGQAETDYMGRRLY